MSAAVLVGLSFIFVGLGFIIAGVDVIRAAVPMVRTQNSPETETHHDSGHLAGLRASPFIQSGVIHSLGHGSDDENNPLASVAPEPFGTQRSQVAVGQRTPCGPGVAQTADTAGDAGRLFIRGGA